MDLKEEEHIDIVGDDSEIESKDKMEEDQPMDEQTHETHVPLLSLPSPGVPPLVPLTVQITQDSTEPSGAKKRKPQKTTKLQVCKLYKIQSSKDIS